MLSIRTRDEVTLPAALRLLRLARSPAEMLALSPEQIGEQIRNCGFAPTKAGQVRTIAAILVDSHGGALPCDRDLLLSLPGVGPKCANLVLGIACGQPQIGVDSHVHRVTNRWGWVRTRQPEETRAALERLVPEQQWVELNRLIVPFGKNVCTPVSPRCSNCLLLEICPRLGVTSHR